MNTNIHEELEKYVRIIQDKFETSIASEHTLRTPLENLLNATKDKEIKVEHEARKAEWEDGTPDFKIFKQIDFKDKLSYPNLIGYIECKKLNEDLDKILKTPQIKKYLEVSPNIILTDYNRFILIAFDKIIEDIALLPFGLEKNNLFADENKITEEIANNFQRLFTQFYGATTRKIKSKKELVKVLSSQAFYLGVKAREFVTDKDNKHSRFAKYFNKTFDTFKEAVNYSFELEEFCDILGQSIVYGLFVAHIENDEESEIDMISDIASLIPPEFALLSEFIYFSTPSFNMPNEIKYTIDNIKKTIGLIHREKIAKDLNTNIDGIAIYLYEDFLKAYDTLRGTEKRKESGVYYTPEPVVKFIVKSIDIILKRKLEREKGFATKEVKTLDFATGTGSFMAEVFNIIIEQEKSPVFKIETIKDKFLKDIYGFEMMFVPYIVAHIKLASILKKEGFNGFNEENKIQVYLTNTLDLERRTLQMSMPLALLEEEYEKAEEIKNREEVLVVIGNPPYNIKSKNRGVKILELLQTYKIGLNEKKINLDDDYIKFIRFAQWKLLEQGRRDLFDGEKSGIMGFITNNSYIWGRTHRKMRESLYNSFDEIFILNLHGNNKDDPKIDQNIFDIQTGVCIGLFIKYDKPNLEKKVHYYSTVENNIFSKQKKFELLQKNFYDLDWRLLDVNEPNYWFTYKDFSNEEYNDFVSLNDVFSVIGSGVKTDRDRLVIDMNKNILDERMKIAFDGNFDENFKEDYRIKDSSSYPLTRRLQRGVFSEKNIIKENYRPFDERFIYYNIGFTSRPSEKAMKHFLNQNNIGLCFPKSIQNKIFDYGLVSDKIIDVAFGGMNTGSETYFASLYLYNRDLEGNIEQNVNFTYDFKNMQSGKSYHDASPEQILSYIYAVLYTPTYRKIYYEYLKVDNPKIPFTDNQQIFSDRVALGNRLITLHLMKDHTEIEDARLGFSENSNRNDISYTIEKMSSKDRYKEETIHLNGDLCVYGVSEDVWRFSVGGYQVIDKWLKYRVGYECSRDDLEHIVRVCNIFTETMLIQNELEKIWGTI